ncbi:MAG TPA: hypothetical protein VGY77_06065 [Gemmataceae bacterium]|nr:hypothetical protein [Gemmataceae bacterium]
MNPLRSPWFTLGPYPTFSCKEPFSPAFLSGSGLGSGLSDSRIFDDIDEDDNPSWETPWIDIGGEG